MLVIKVLKSFYLKMIYLGTWRRSFHWTEVITSVDLWKIVSQTLFSLWPSLHTVITVTLETVWAVCWILFHLTGVSLMVQGEAIPPHDTMDQHPTDSAKHEAVEIQVFSIKGKLWFISTDYQGSSHHFNRSNRATCKRGQLFCIIAQAVHCKHPSQVTDQLPGSALTY